MALNIIIGKLLAPDPQGDQEFPERLEPLVNIRVEDDMVDLLGGERAVVAAVFQGLSFGARGDIGLPDVAVADVPPTPGLTEDELADLLKNSEEKDDVERS